MLMHALAASCEELRARTGNPPLHGRFLLRFQLRFSPFGGCEGVATKIAAKIARVNGPLNCSNGYFNESQNQLNLSSFLCQI